MTVTPPTDLNRLRHLIPAFADEAKARATEFEADRTIAPDFVARLKQAGAYRILVACEQGGLGGSLRDWLDMVQTLATADASTGWTIGHGAICGALVANIAETSFVEAAFADPDVSFAWSNLPRVTVTPEAGGLRVDGRFSFMTGCSAADYVGGIVPGFGSDGQPRKVVALARASETVIDRTWDPVGMAGTGSHDVVLHNVLVPQDRIFGWPDARANVTLPTRVFVPGTWFISICAAATHLGLARRALDEARAELHGKKDRYSGLPLIEEQTVLRSLEEAEGLLFVCRAGVDSALDTIWECGQRGDDLSDDMRINARLACVTAVHQGARIVQTAYGLGGAAATRRAGVLQRLYRDAACLTHHVSSNLRSFDDVGRSRIGLDPVDFVI